MRTFGHSNVDVQCVAAHQATGGMHQNVVTNLIAFWVKALQNSQGSLVQISDNGAL